MALARDFPKTFYPYLFSCHSTKSTQTGLRGTCEHGNVHVSPRARHIGGVEGPFVSMRWPTEIVPEIYNTTGWAREAGKIAFRSLFAALQQEANKGSGASNQRPSSLSYLQYLRYLPQQDDRETSRYVSFLPRSFSPPPSPAAHRMCAYGQAGLPLAMKPWNRLSPDRQTAVLRPSS